MAELSVAFGVPVGEMKIGDKEYTLYRLKLKDMACLEQIYGKPIADIFTDPNLTRSVTLILDALTLSIQKGDATVTKDFLGEALDLSDPEFQRSIQEMLPKIFGNEQPDTELGKKGQQKASK